MPVTSSSVPPKGRRISICSSDSGKTTHSRPRAFTSDPTAKRIPTSYIYTDTATPHPEGDREGPNPASTLLPPLQRLPRHTEGHSLSHYLPKIFGYSAILLAQSSSCPKRITM